MNSLDLRYGQKEESGTRTFTVVEKIWGFFYKCTIPEFQSRTVEDISRKGMIVSGIKEIDDDAKLVRVSRYLTINDMVDLFTRNITVGVVEFSDTKDIYDTVQTHLLQWMETLRTGLNISDAPIQELIAMDKFAAAVYPHAKYLILPEAVHSEMAKLITSSHAINRMNFFDTSKLPSRTIKEGDGSITSNSIDPSKDKQGLPIRESLADRFRESLSVLRRY